MAKKITRKEVALVNEYIDQFAKERRDLEEEVTQCLLKLLTAELRKDKPSIKRLVNLMALYKSVR